MASACFVETLGTNSPFTSPIRRKSLPDDPDFVDTSGILRLYTSDNCKPPLRCSPQMFTIPAMAFLKHNAGAVCVAPASGPHAVKPRSRKGTEPGSHLTARDWSNARAGVGWSANVPSQSGIERSAGPRLGRE